MLGAGMKGSEVVVIAQRLVNNVSVQCLFLAFVKLTRIQSLVNTIIFYFNVITGQDVIETSPIGEPFEGFENISGPIVKCFLSQNPRKSSVPLFPCPITRSVEQKCFSQHSYFAYYPFLCH